MLFSSPYLESHALISPDSVYGSVPRHLVRFLLLSGQDPCVNTQTLVGQPRGEVVVSSSIRFHEIVGLC